MCGWPIPGLCCWRLLPLPGRSLWRDPKPGVAVVLGSVPGRSLWRVRWLDLTQLHCYLPRWNLLPSWIDATISVSDRAIRFKFWLGICSVLRPLRAWVLWHEFRFDFCDLQRHVLSWLLVQWRFIDTVSILMRGWILWKHNWSDECFMLGSMCARSLWKYSRLDVCAMLWAMCGWLLWLSCWSLVACLLGPMRSRILQQLQRHDYAAVCRPLFARLLWQLLRLD